MLFTIQKRELLKKIHKFRWDGRERPKMDMGTVAERYAYGIKEDSVGFTLVTDEVIGTPTFVRNILKCLRKRQYNQFLSKIQHWIEILKDEGYVKVDNGYIRLKEKGEDFIKWYYYLKIIYNNYIFRTLIMTLIQWGIPLVAIYILLHFFNINIQTKP